MKNLKLHTKRKHNRCDRRRGVVAAQVLLLLPVIIGFAVLTVDVGTLYNTRSDLQSAADSAALASAIELTTDEMMAVRYGSSSTSLTSTIANTASHYTSLNSTFDRTSLSVESGDIRFGEILLSSSSGALDTSVGLDALNAIEVTIRCDANSANGPAALFFTSLFGYNTADVHASATAAFDDRFVGFTPPNGEGPLIPFAVHENIFFAISADGYSFDSDTETIDTTSDGIPELNLYPHAGDASGNFGLLNIGSNNMGVPELREDIESGVTADDLIAEGIPDGLLSFYDSDGNPTTYNISGNPGMKTTLQTSIETRIGQTVGFLLHDGASGNGANAVFHITGIRFGRVMATKLNGNPNGRYVWIQPVTYSGPGVTVGPSAPSSDGVAGSLQLVR